MFCQDREGVRAFVPKFLIIVFHKANVLLNAMTIARLFSVYFKFPPRVGKKCLHFALDVLIGIVFAQSQVFS